MQIHGYWYCIYVHVCVQYGYSTVYQHSITIGKFNYNHGINWWFDHVWSAKHTQESWDNCFSIFSRAWEMMTNDVLQNSHVPEVLVDINPGTNRVDHWASAVLCPKLVGERCQYPRSARGWWHISWHLVAMLSRDAIRNPRRAPIHRCGKWN